MFISFLCQKLTLKIFALLMSIFYAVNGPLVPPSTDDVIKPKDADNVQMVFAAVADPQVSTYLLSRYAAFKESCMDFKNADCTFDAVVSVGDIAENGLADEYQLVYDEFKDIDSRRFIMASGNHDIRMRLYSQSVSRFCNFTNSLNGEQAMTKLSYSERINGYKFIVLGSDKTELEETYLSPEQLSWLDSELETESGKPVFVLCHQPLKLTHGLPLTWGNGKNKNAGSVGAQNDELKAILAKHSKDSTVIFITGHLHTAFGDYTYEEIEGFHSVNLPSLSIGNKDGKYNESGLAFICEVYENEVIFRARNAQKGEWLPDCDITIPVK